MCLAARATIRAAVIEYESTTPEQSERGTEYFTVWSRPCSRNLCVAQQADEGSSMTHTWWSHFFPILMVDVKVKLSACNCVTFRLTRDWWCSDIQQPSQRSHFSLDLNSRSTFPGPGADRTGHRCRFLAHLPPRYARTDAARGRGKPTAAVSLQPELGPAAAVETLAHRTVLLSGERKHYTNMTALHKSGATNEAWTLT